MIAASSIGAEYSSGSIANWLTFIPRRGHVFWSKLLTLTGFAAAARRLRCHVRALRRLQSSPDSTLPHRVVAIARGAGSAQRPGRDRACRARLLCRFGDSAYRWRDWCLLGVRVRLVRPEWAVLGSRCGSQRLTPWTPEGESRGNRGARPHLLRADQKMTPEGASVEWWSRPSASRTAPSTGRS